MKKKVEMIVFLLILILSSGKQIWAQEKVDTSRFYLKGGIGRGGIIEEIPLYMWIETGEEVKIERWTGVHFNLDVGYDITRELSIELGLGYHKNTIRAGIKGGDGYFTRVPLTVTLVYHFFKKEIFNVYLGGGIGYYASPELYRKVWELEENIVKYEDAFGYHGLLGVLVNFEKRWFSFIDIKYVFGVKYKFKEMVVNGRRYDFTFPKWRELDGSGVLVNLGVGYRF